MTYNESKNQRFVKKKLTCYGNNLREMNFFHVSLVLNLFECFVSFIVRNLSKTRITNKSCEGEESLILKFKMCCYPLYL